MNRVKIFAIVLVILAGLVSSYLILRNPGQANVSGNIYGANDKIADLSKAILDKNPIQWVEKAKEQISVAADSAVSQVSGKQNSSGVPNLTNAIAKQMFSGMKNIAQNGVGDTQGGFNSDDPQNQQLINDAINNIQNPFAGYDLSVDEKSIKISQDNSGQNKINYLEAVSNIIMKYRTDAYRDPLSAVDKAVMSADLSPLEQLIGTYKNLYSGLISLSVPSDWFALHKSYLEFMKKAEAVYSGIADISNDPVRASLFVQMAPDILNQEIQIRKEYYKFVSG